MAEQSLAPGAPNIGPLLIAVWICTVLLTAECSLACRHQLLSPARRGILFLRMTVGALIVCNAVSLIAQFVLVYRMASPNPADVKAASHNRWELSLFITAAGISSGISNAFRVSRIWRLLKSNWKAVALALMPIFTVGAALSTAAQLSYHSEGYRGSTQSITIWLAANLGTNVVVGGALVATLLNIRHQASQFKQSQLGIPLRHLLRNALETGAITWFYSTACLITWLAGPLAVSMGMTFLIPHVQGLSLLIAINNTSAFAAREAPTLEHIQTNFPTSSQLLHRAKMMSLADSRRGSRYISDDGDGSPPRVSISPPPSVILHDVWAKGEYLPTVMVTNAEGLAV